MARSLFIVIIMVAAGLAGCGDKAPAPDPDGLSGETVVLAGHVIAVERGLVTGTVLNDAGLALKGARVSLLGTDFFGDTDKQGEFAFLNVTPGRYDLQVTSQGFQPHKRPIDVVASQWANTTVQLLPTQGVGAGSRPHLHDHWKGRDVVDIMDAEIPFIRDEGGTYPDQYYLLTNGVLRPITNSTRWKVPLVESPEGEAPIVFPGTKQLDITISWTARLEKLGLCYNTPADGKWTCLGPKPSGGQWTIQATPEMADNGHQVWSQWFFEMYHPGTGEAPDYTPGVATDAMQAKITIHRGEIVLEDAHETFWDEGPVIHVREAKSGETTSTVCCSSMPSFRLDSGQIVPPGTTRMRIEHTWKFTGEGAGPADYDFRMLVRNGAMNPQTTTVNDYLEPMPVEGAPGDFRYVYEFDVSKEETDAFYQSRTNWEFRIYNTALERDSPHVKYRGEVHYVDVWVYNDDLR